MPYTGQPPPYPGSRPQFPFQPPLGQQPYSQQFPPGGPGAAWPGRPPVQPGTSGFAIASLILGMLGGVVLSVIFGIVALVTIKRTGQAGRGTAIAGLVVSGLWAVALGSLFALVAFTSADRDEQGVITRGGDVRADSLQVGDCISELKVAAVSSLPAVPCGQAHEGEVFAGFDLPAGDYPGAEEVDRLVEEGCDARLEAYSTSAVQNPQVGVFVLYPLELNWSEGDRSVTCILQRVAGAPLTGSLQGT